MLSGLSPLTNLMAHYTHLLKHIRRNMLILTLSVPMQSNRTYFFSFSGCSEAYNLSRYPQWDTLNSQAAEQAYSSSKSFKGFLSYINEKNFMTHCIFFIWYQNSLRRKQLESQGVAISDKFYGTNN